ncbi:MAG: AEC family transporter [Lachnospiraceae bacterium]|nr:AEC family transporter [Lachnospiraceae bacterium]
MDNLLFCLNATIPIFLLMILGLIFKRTGMFDDAFVKRMNTFVFKAALPVLLFQELSGADFIQVWDGVFVLFCFTATALSIAIAVAAARLWKDRSIQGEFAQAAYRSSAALLGIGFIQNIYGNAGMAPLMIIGTVPLYNVMAVVILAFMKPERETINGALMKKTGLEILTNPIILGILAGMAWSALSLPQPVIMQKTLKYVANLATPLGLMAMGATFDWRAARKKWKPAVVCSGMKLVLFCAIFLPIAVGLGFRESRLVAVLVMLGSPTTVSCFVMAKNMGHEGTVSSSAVMVTTFLSAFTLTIWLYVIRTMGLI